MQSRRNIVEALEPRRLLSSISGVVFVDANGNGAMDTGEAPFGGAKVFLDRNNNGVADAGEPSVLADLLGHYSFTGLSAGTYEVGAATVPPGGYKQTTKPPAGVIPLAATHDYALKGSFADAKGGPALKSGGGTISSSGYTFAAGQGLTLSNALTSTGSYSIQVVFTPKTIGGYQKIIDFKNRTIDQGLYSLNGTLELFPVQSAPTAAIKAGQSMDVVLTRDASTKVVTAYINGAKQFSVVGYRGPCHLHWSQCHHQHSRGRSAGQ
jgi:hypothetical protein